MKKTFTLEDFQKWGSAGGTKAKNSHKLSSAEARRIAKIRHNKKKAKTV